MATQMTPAELAASRLNKGKTTAELLKEAKDKNVRKKMEGMKMSTDIGETPAGTSMSDESKAQIDATNKGYEYATKNKRKGGMVKKYAKGGSASSRADGCAVKGKTRGKFV
jgi:hypothetical protein